MKKTTKKLYLLLGSMSLVALPFTIISCKKNGMNDNETKETNFVISQIKKQQNDNSINLSISFSKFSKETVQKVELGYQKENDSIIQNVELNNVTLSNGIIFVLNNLETNTKYKLIFLIIDGFNITDLNYEFILENKINNVPSESEKPIENPTENPGSGDIDSGGNQPLPKPEPQPGHNPGSSEPNLPENTPDRKHQEIEFVLPKLNKLDVNTPITNPGNISNPKTVFDHTEFPKEIVLEKNTHNDNLIENYFRNEMKKVLQYIIGQGAETPDIPRWFNIYSTQEEQPDFYSYIPDLIVRLKENDNLYAYNHSIFPSLVHDNELTIKENKLVWQKNLTNFLNKDFSKRKIRFTLEKQKPTTFFLSGIAKTPIFVDIDLESLLNSENKTLTERIENSNYSFSATIIDSQIKVEFTNNENKEFSFDFADNQTKDVFSKFGITTEISYLTKEENNELFTISSKPFINDSHAKLTTNQNFYSDENNLKAYSGLRVLPKDTNSFFDKIRQRVFVVGGGTSTMVSKVKPSDPNSTLYYFITNRHVSDILETRWNDPRVLNKVLIPDFSDEKIRNSASDISVDVQKNWFEFNFWQAKDQTRRNGTIDNNRNFKDADISINIIDIKPILDKAIAENNTKIINYFQNWNNLEPLKLSKKTKYLEKDNYVKFYLSSFPQDPHAGFSGRRYREHIINKLEDIRPSDQAREFSTYGNFRSFFIKDKEGFGIKYDLISGGSGSVVYDEEFNMVALFMQNLGDDEYGFGLLSSLDYDYFGYETNNNPNSFKKKLEEKTTENPNKFELIEL
ncbi:hypothetical protein [Mycoplasmopsis felis]|uniref:hypothetical protein n=1 Tax=Mycoplasmopsis felis TaxID=33923 RepID=UPI002AFE9101|nr:hypothetical protein [Mycoplasmopsis felis]WQQ06887.1 hypothetical protein RRG37_03465 [Mycoplasmopsis felis]